MSVHVPNQRELLRDLKRRGWHIKQSGPHIKAVAPRGGQVSISRSPGDPRTMLHLLAIIKRIDATP